LGTRTFTKDSLDLVRFDYAKQGGEWIPNLYSDNHCLDAVEFMKYMNSILQC